MSDDAILRRLRKVEDRDAIRDLIGRYSLAVDNHDFDALGALWHPHATYGWVGQPPQAEGAAAIRALLESRIGPAGPSFHVNHDQIVDWDENDPDRASAVVFCHAEVTPDGSQYQAAIRYHDRYIRHEGRWLFAERRLGFLYFTPPSSYEGILLRRERMLPGGQRNPAHWPAFG